MFHWKKKETEDTLRAAAEIAGDQVAPGAGKWFLIAGGLALSAAAAYLIARKNKNKKAAR